MHVPEPSQVLQKADVPAEQQVVWQSPDEHWLSAAHAVPAPSREQSPAITLYGLLQAVHAPVASQAEH